MAEKKTPSWLYVEIIDDSMPRAGISNDVLRRVIRVQLTDSQSQQLSYVTPYESLRAISVQEL